MVTIKVHLLDSLVKKSIGLILAKKAYPVMLHTRFGVHTFGMRFPIDIVLLNDENIVVNLWKSVFPNRIVIYPLRYKTVLELPQGMVQSSQITIGEKIKIIVSELEGK